MSTGKIIGPISFFFRYHKFTSECYIMTSFLNICYISSEQTALSKVEQLAPCSNVFDIFIPHAYFLI
jgi:hypothetical protein